MERLQHRLACATCTASSEQRSPVARRLKVLVVVSVTLRRVLKVQVLCVVCPRPELLFGCVTRVDGNVLNVSVHKQRLNRTSCLVTAHEHARYIAAQLCGIALVWRPRFVGPKVAALLRDGQGFAGQLCQEVDERVDVVPGPHAGFSGRR
jgi:hypothetical protein